jgi:hypothetical protein
MLKKIGLGGIIFVLLILSTFAVASTAETKTIRSDGVPVELDNLWNVTPTVELSISADMQLTITGLDTGADTPADRQPNTLGFSIYPDFPDFADSCFLTPQPYLTTLPPGHVTQEADGSFTLTFNLSDLKQNSCPHTLQYYIDHGAFGSRVEVSDNYGNPVLYSEPFIADLAPETPICRYIATVDGIDQAEEAIYALDLDPEITESLMRKLSDVEEKFTENPPDLHAARGDVGSFVNEIEDAWEDGAITADEANHLLNIASGILASITF